MFGEDEAPKAPPLVRVEADKSGRATCRRCSNKIDKGETRFGLEAWIAGRVAVGWQHRKCFPMGFMFEEAKSSRGKCKHSGEGFNKGEVRFAVSKELKLFIKLACVDEALAEAVRSLDGVFLDDIEGYQELGAEQRRDVANIITKFSPSAANQPQAGSDETAGRKRRPYTKAGGSSGDKAKKAKRNAT